jgi:hypothetical protein
MTGEVEDDERVEAETGLPGDSSNRLTGSVDAKPSSPRRFRNWRRVEAACDVNDTVNSSVRISDIV